MHQPAGTAPRNRPPSGPCSNTRPDNRAGNCRTPAVTGTPWKVGWYDDTKGVWSKVIQDSTITATFGKDGIRTGSGGCNQYSTDYHFGDNSRIWIRRPTVPETLCQSPTGVMNQESAYFTDLSWADNYKVENGQLLFFDKSGKKIV